MKVAVLGTGLMGRPMAERFIRSGYPVVVYNRTAKKAAPLKNLGAEIAKTPLQAIEKADFIILMLADAAAIRDTLFPVKAPKPSLTGRTVIQMGTISPQESLRFKKRVEHAGGRYLEAPVLGSIAQVERGELIVMVGSEPEDFEQGLPLLRCLCAEPCYVGPVGKAAALKLALNQLIAALTVGFSFSLGIIRRREIDTELFMKIVRESSLYAPQFDKKLPGMLRRDFVKANFPTRHFFKDIGLMLQEGHTLGLETSALTGCWRAAKKALEQGWVDTDYSSVYNVIDPEK